MPPHSIKALCSPCKSLVQKAKEEKWNRLHSIILAPAFKAMAVLPKQHLQSLHKAIRTESQTDYTEYMQMVQAVRVLLQMLMITEDVFLQDA